MQIIDCEQGSYDWHALRAGRFTATDAKAVKVHGEGLDTLAYQIASFKITGQLPDIISTPAMERGKMLEPIARSTYEEVTGQEVKTVGFCAQDDFVGCSPDGLVGENGLIEIKCKTNSHHLFAVANHWVDPNPDFAPTSIYIRTIERNEEMIGKLQEGLEIGRKLVQEAIDKFNGVYKI